MLARETVFAHALNRRDHDQVVAAGCIPDQRHAQKGRILPHYALVYVVAGSGWFESGNGPRQKVATGDVLVLFPGLKHSYGPSSHWDEHWIAFGGPLFRHLEDSGLIDRTRAMLSPGLQPLVIDGFTRLLRDLRMHANQALMVAQTHQLIAHIVELHDGVSPAHTQAIVEACRLLDAHPERPVDPLHLARTVGLGYELFRKRFVAAVGVPPMRYRLLRRIDMAKQLLAAGQLPLTDIAARLGFCDAQMFSRQFKRFTGRTPAGFRKVFSGLAG